MFHSPQKPSSGFVLFIPPPSRSIVLPPPHALTIGARRHPEAFVEPRGEMRRAREAEAVGDVGDRRARRQYSPRRKVQPVGADIIGEIHAEDALEAARSEEHTYELQSLMRISYA